MCLPQVSLVALGPLTNLALAVRLDPRFPQKLKELYIMGGNMEGNTSTWALLVFEACRLVFLDFLCVGIGNVTLCAEFNFATDPESAYIVLEEYICPTYVATWEYSCRNAMPWVRCVLVKNHIECKCTTASFETDFTVQDFFEELMNQDAPAARFMKTITSQSWAYSKEAMKKKRDVYFGPGFVFFDAYAMAACINSSLVTESIECPVRVELQGSMARGMMALDRTNQLKKSHSVFVLTKCDVAKFSQLLLKSVNQPCKK